MEQQWEYCQVWYGGTEDHKNQSYYDLSIFYMGESVVRLLLSELHSASKTAKPLPYNPYRKTIALLGLGGWELVNVQHSDGSHMYAHLLYFSPAVAYFKRPKQPGRAVDYPKIVLPVS